MIGHICDRCGHPYLTPNPDTVVCRPCYLGALPAAERARELVKGATFVKQFRVTERARHQP